ncbi:MAG: hypothetical protein ACOZAL_02675 [Patescibacteria group bacterium]
MIDPNFFLDEELAKLSPHARLLYIGSWTIADDNVFTFPCRPGWIKVQLFPYEKRLDMIKLINELIESKHYILFESNGSKYIYIPTMKEHQKIERPSKQKYPCYDGSPNIPQLLTESSPNTLPEVKLIEEKLKEDKLNKIGASPILKKEEKISLSPKEQRERIKKLVQPIVKNFEKETNPDKDLIWKLIQWSAFFMATKDGMVDVKLHKFAIEKLRSCFEKEWVPRLAKMSHEHFKRCIYSLETQPDKDHREELEKQWRKSPVGVWIYRLNNPQKFAGT